MSYSERECVKCGKVIRESRYSGNGGNFRRHVGSKNCANSTPKTSAPTRNERILESGYEAYAREEGYYD